MLEKIFTTFYALNALLQQQYQEHRFKKYSKLMSCFLITKQNNEFLIRDYQSHPTGYESFLEINAISSQTRGHGQENGHGRERNSQCHSAHGSHSSNS